MAQLQGSIKRIPGICGAVQGTQCYPFKIPQFAGFGVDFDSLFIGLQSFFMAAQLSQCDTLAGPSEYVLTTIEDKP